MVHKNYSIRLFDTGDLSGWCTGGPGDWHLTENVIIHLGGRTFEGLEGEEFCFTGHDLCISCGFTWDGSSVVQDTDACRLPSLFHDVVYRAIETGDLSRRQRRRLRRRADKMYVWACELRGMWGIRAGLRFWGLRTLSPVYRAWKRWRG